MHGSPFERGELIVGYYTVRLFRKMVAFNAEEIKALHKHVRPLENESDTIRRLIVETAVTNGPPRLDAKRSVRKGK
jgi:hypothetical protein